MLKNPDSPRIVVEGIIKQWIAAGSPGRDPTGGENITAITAFLQTKAADFRAAGDEHQARFWDSVAVIWPPLAARIRPDSERHAPSKILH